MKSDAPPNVDLLSVTGLTASFHVKGRIIPVLHDVSFSLKAGETLALVGESGSGKSVTAQSIMRLMRDCSIGGRVELNGKDLLSLSRRDMARVRGREIAMIFQDPRMSLNPTLSIGVQISEVLQRHRGLSAAQARAEALRLLDAVRISGPSRRYDEHPHQLSGGMCQRVMIASAIAGEPRLLIADEATTALDVTVQAEILTLLRELQNETGMAMLVVTHDMGVVAEIANGAAVMRQGRIVEFADTQTLLTRPADPYTQDLLASVPKLGSMAGQAAPRYFPVAGKVPAATDCVVAGQDTILSVRDLNVRYRSRSSFLGISKGSNHAVRGVTFDLRSGETLALVGESGSGKSTIGRAILGLSPVTSGQVILAGQEMTSLRGEPLRQARRAAQMVFQDPAASLSPRQRIRDAISEPLRAWGETGDINAVVHDLLVQVGLEPEMADRLPHEFSGGQRQRICIARAMALRPSLIVADEAVSALDVSVKARICNLLLDIQRQTGVACLFISHDMAVVERLSDRVAVMRNGAILEIGSRRDVFESPQHAYTRALLAAVPNPVPRTSQASISRQ
ncbi:dipeptide ABC transporter ATP-binding protein [Rhizobium oryzicola]|uniref:Glutathione import ATP-binding protein GsiA n=1 Tax=Rhizobium oryzicola TaxID=1232668 RepID=A0ABT8SVZ8_9HYPH|nr:ABC transporter ATP-binding protein [Rhizobium oryzicola]MDO1582597.1 ABC transporter ATP-binding protein [Rhizobium oryzicola]